MTRTNSTSDDTPDPRSNNAREAVDEVQRAFGSGDIPALILALKHPLLDVRLTAVDALGDLGGQSAGIALVSLARDRYGERPDVRIAALLSLKRITDPRRYASLLEEFVTGDNRKVVSAARRMLADIDPSGFPGRLVNRGCLDHSAINVYGRAGEETAVPMLVDFLLERMDSGDFATTGYWGKVYAAVRALGAIGGDRAVRTLESVLEKMTEQVYLEQGFLKKERAEKIKQAARDSIERADSSRNNQEHY